MDRQMSQDFENIFGRDMRSVAQQQENIFGRDMRAVAQQQREQMRQLAESTSRSSSSSSTVAVRPGQPSVSIELQEESRGIRGQSSSYSYFSRVEVYSGGGSLGYAVAPPLAAAAGPSPLLFVAAFAAAAYTAFALAFAKAYELTTYSNKFRWVMSIFWLPLVLVNPKFRAQWLAALKGKRMGVLRPEEEIEVKLQREDEGGQRGPPTSSTS